MAEKYLLQIEAERFIHNDLSNCSWDFQQRMRSQIEADDRAGLYHTMMASLVFSAFSMEAKLNFVGWRIFGRGWPERASLREKIELLHVHLDLRWSWAERPLQTIAKLKRFRDVLAHGKPEIVDKEVEVVGKPDVWDALKGQWEQTVTPEFVDQCRTDEDHIWKCLLEKSGIQMYETLTHGGHTLKAIVEGEQA